MEIHKIKKMYCKDDKVQVMFSNAPSQIIFSESGYLYLRKGKLTIHAYLNDPVRNKMPYKNNPSSSNHATHLFEYDKTYVKFTSDRAMGGSFKYHDSYSLTFLHFIRAENGEAILAEASLTDFELEEEKKAILSKEKLKKFLYDVDGVDAKAIFEWFSGIMYFSHINEDIGIFNKNFLDLSDEEIIERYNRKNEPLILFNEEERERKMKERAWEVHSIDEVKEFVLTRHGMFTDYYPMLLVVKGNNIVVYDFEVTFLERDRFRLSIKKRNISLTYNDILREANNLEYPNDPEFEDD